MFSSIEDVIDKFAEQQYICNRRLATVVYLASHLRKPILVEGPAGVGKTELAKVLADFELRIAHAIETAAEDLDLLQGGAGEYPETDDLISILRRNAPK